MQKSRAERYEVYLAAVVTLSASFVDASALSATRGDECQADDSDDRACNSRSESPCGLAARHVEGPLSKVGFAKSLASDSDDSACSWRSESPLGLAARHSERALSTGWLLKYAYESPPKRLMLLSSARAMPETPATSATATAKLFII